MGNLSENNPKSIMIFSGAGLSAESGIPTFRDTNGLWENYKVEDVATLEGWKRDPALVLDFYAQRFRSVVMARPNAAHLAIARLEEKFKVINVTQNIDNLLERSGCTDVRHLHGSLFERKCSSSKCDYNVPHFNPVKLGDLCSVCNSQMRPKVVWFGEPVEMYKNKMKSLAWHMTNDGVFVSVGTSARVYPAASMLDIFSRVRSKYYIDLIPSERPGFINLSGFATETLPKLVDMLIGD